MKILYAIQGTGNGHMSRAQELLPYFRQYGTVDVLVSGTQSQLDVSFEINYRTKGMSFVASKSGGVHFLKTLLNLRPIRFFKEVFSLPVKKYDLVISDFEPVSAWACKFRGFPCIELSHQCAVKMATTPKPKASFPIGQWIVENYCPSSKQYGVHFQSYNDMVFFPIIRNEIKRLNPVDEGFYLVYLTGYSDETILEVLREIKQTWRVYSRDSIEITQKNNLMFCPIDNKRFMSDLEKCKGILCGAGFELPAEALFLGKKLMVIPYNNHFEQQCNAEALRQLGIPVLYDLSMAALAEIKSWTESLTAVKIHMPDQTAALVEKIVTENVKTATPVKD